MITHIFGKVVLLSSFWQIRFSAHRFCTGCRFGGNITRQIACSSRHITLNATRQIRGYSRRLFYKSGYIGNRANRTITMSRKIKQENTCRKEQRDQNGRGSSQKGSRTARTEHSSRGTTAERRTRISTLAVLNEHQTDYTNGQNHVNY